MTKGQALACLNVDICTASDVPGVVRRGAIELTDSSRASTKDREATTVERGRFCAASCLCGRDGLKILRRCAEVLVLFPSAHPSKRHLLRCRGSNPAPATW